MKRKNRLKWVLYFSLFCNLVFALLLWWMLLRLGGVRYAFFKFKQDHAGLYQHRKNQFELLPPKPGALVFLGDSQIQEAEWAELLGDSLPVLNRGIAGDHLEGLQNRLSTVMATHPRKIFLEIGINDLLFGKKIPEIAASYEKTVELIQQSDPSTQIIVHSILPVNNSIKYLGIDNATIRAANVALAQMAARKGLPFVDLYGALSDEQGNLNAVYTEDGLHLNGKAYLIWKTSIEQFLK